MSRHPRSRHRARNASPLTTRSALVVLAVVLLCAGGWLTARQLGGSPSSGPRAADVAAEGTAPAGAPSGRPPGVAQVATTPTPPPSPSEPAAGASGTTTATSASGRAGTSSPAAPRTTAAQPAPRTTTPPAAAAPSAGHSATEAQVLTIVNRERAAAGCAPVRADAALARLARAHSADMAARDYFSHVTPDGLDPWDRARAAGVGNLAAENIARGQATPEAVMRSWMNSSGHRKNILDCDLRTLGVGVHEGSGGPWWTQAFGR